MEQEKILDYEGVKNLAKQLLDACELKKYNQFLMVDSKTGYKYIIQIENGNLISYCVRNYTGIEVTTLPSKTEYTAGTAFDPSGMIVAILDEYGTSTEITDYTYTEYATKDTITISYMDNGVEYTTTIEISLIPFDPETLLIDFEYVANEDGTYTITSWNGTLNGAPSTECVIPDNALINV